MENAALQDALIEAALPNVVFEGWSLAALRDGARTLGWSPEKVTRMFPGGVGMAVAAFHRGVDRRMDAAMAGENLDGIGVRERLSLCLRHRLAVLAPHKEAVRRTVAFLALPPHNGLGVRLLAETTDHFWRIAEGRRDASAGGEDPLASDGASDTGNQSGRTALATLIKPYSQRLVLASILTATIFYWLDDNSGDDEATLLFFRQRLGDVQTLGKTLRQGLEPRTLLTLLPSPSRFVRQMRRRMAEGG